MGNKALRTRLASLLKEHKSNTRLYTCHKHQAYRRLKASTLRHMIAHLENVSPGDKVYDYGVNQVVSDPLTFEKIDCISVKQNKNKNCSKDNEFIITKIRGEVVVQAEQLRYKSGYSGCGCGNYHCNVDKNLKTKEEIVSGFLQQLYNEYGPSYLAKDYFKCLESGIDILTEDGFLVDNYRELIESVNQ